MEWNEDTRVLIRWTTTEVTTYSATLDLSQIFGDGLPNALAALSEGRELYKVIEEYEALGEQENGNRIVGGEYLGDREIDSATLTRAPATGTEAWNDAYNYSGVSDYADYYLTLWLETDPEDREFHDHSELYPTWMRAHTR